MLLPLFVIQKAFLPHTLLQRLPGDDGLLRSHFPVGHRHFQHIKGHPGIPIGKPGDHVHHVVGYVDIQIPKPLLMVQSPFQEFCQILHGQGLQHKHTASGQKSAVDLKGRILRGGADKDDASFFHIGQKSILLSLIKAVDLIHKHHGLNSHPPVGFRLGHNFFDLLDPAGDRAEINKPGMGLMGNDPRKRSLPHPRRPPEDHRRYLVILYEPTQHVSLSQQMLLARKLLQSLRPYPAGQRMIRLLTVKQ